MSVATITPIHVEETPTGEVRRLRAVG